MGSTRRYHFLLGRWSPAPGLSSQTWLDSPKVFSFFVECGSDQVQARPSLGQAWSSFAQAWPSLGQPLPSLGQALPSFGKAWPSLGKAWQGLAGPSQGLARHGISMGSLWNHYGIIMGSFGALKRPLWGPTAFTNCPTRRACGLGGRRRGARALLGTLGSLWVPLKPTLPGPLKPSP